MIKVSDYIAEFLADYGVREVFMVTGGGAMHLDDALGHSKRLRATYGLRHGGRGLFQNT